MSRASSASSGRAANWMFRPYRPGRFPRPSPLKSRAPAPGGPATSGTGATSLVASGEPGASGSAGAGTGLARLEASGALGTPVRVEAALGAGPAPPRPPTGRARCPPLRRSTSDARSGKSSARSTRTVSRSRSTGRRVAPLRELHAHRLLDCLAIGEVEGTAGTRAHEVALVEGEALGQGRGLDETADA